MSAIADNGRRDCLLASEGVGSTNHTSAVFQSPTFTTASCVGHPTVISIGPVPELLGCTMILGIT